MCGFAGIARSEPSGVAPATLSAMVAAIRHRGPDGFGYYTDSRVGLSHVRLSVIDPAGGAQPMTNENGRVVIVYNGEIYNYIELARELAAAGHRFRTRSDTEVIIHGYEEWGARVLDRLNGEFAFALYDRGTESVLLARDRFGVRPLFWAVRGGDLYFGSEVKALLASGAVAAEPDLRGIDEVFTFWAARPPRTVFRGVSSLPPGTFAVWRNGSLRTVPYYRPRFDEARHEPEDAIRQLNALMSSSIGLRMRSDVPVGSYLSGGLDSSITSWLAARHSPLPLRTFSVTFDDNPLLNEAPFQRLAAEQLRSIHHTQGVRIGALPEVFPRVIWHTETPIVRMAPVPLFLLSRLVRESGTKVVLTGEGADELFLGYDLFKETLVRLFCLRQPASASRPLLFDRLYPYLNRGTRGSVFWRRFFMQYADRSDPLFSHMPRFGLTAQIKGFYSDAVRHELAEADPLEDLRSDLPPEFDRWSPLNRAAWLELTTLLSPYLLSSQGDRMALAHGVETRFPFLDHRLFEFAAALPGPSKLLGLNEKHILRRWAATILPPRLASRSKQPVRAPDVPAFFPVTPPYVRDLLASDALLDSGLFAPAAVRGLVRRCEAGLATGFRESQALVGIISAQLWHQQFCAAGGAQPGLPMPRPDVVITGDRTTPDPTATPHMMRLS